LGSKEVGCLCGGDGGSDTDGELESDSDGEGSDTDGEVDSNDVDQSAEKSVPRSKKKRKEVVDDDESWEEDEEEYVGLNEENQYMSALNDDNAGSDSDAYDFDCSDKDDLYVDDEAGCEVLEHVTDLENPTIACGVTFEDGDTFKGAIRQFAVLNEFEIAALYSESTRYRGIYKGSKSKKKMCKWRIHASQLQYGKTWQVCYCANHFCCLTNLQIKKIFSKHVYFWALFLLSNCFADKEDV
jgi:hypothetical protein